MRPAPGPRAELESIFREALAAVHAGALVRGAVEGRGAELRIAGERLPGAARLVVLAAGKAAAPMAAALEDTLGERIARGMVVVPEGPQRPLARLVLRVAAHPVPDARSEGAAREALALVEGCSPEDLLLVLLSGGASSLLGAPAPGLALEDLAAAGAALLAGGCDIEETNCVRKHLGAVAGGRLARRARAGRIEVLALSDVPGDRLDVLGSGPCAADPTSFADALAVLERRGLRQRVPARVVEHLEAGLRGEVEETPKPGDPRLARVRHTVLAGNHRAREAAREAARNRGLAAVDLGEALRGEARGAGRRLAALGRSLAPGAPVCAVAGGETAVSVRGPGLGGRSQELALAAAIELEGCPDVALLAAGTDGRDGPTDAAGAYADGGTLARGRRRGLEARAALDANDSHRFFAAEGGVYRTGSTGTNVMDLVLLHVAGGVPAAAESG